MVEIIKNFKYGIVFAMICTCLQSYGLYEYGAGLTYTHPIGYTFLFAVLFRIIELEVIQVIILVFYFI